MKKKSVERRYVLIGVCFLLPAVVAYLVFMAYPLCRTAYLSVSYTHMTLPTKLEV